MKRRDFITMLGFAAAASLWSRAGHAQQRAMARVGVVMGYRAGDPVALALLAAFRQGLAKAGWVEGRNVAFDVRFATDDREQIRAHAVQLMSLKPDLMVSNSNLVTAVLQAEVRTVPLLFIGATDPIASGFVTNFARPTGNITGFSIFDTSMGSKWLETLKEIAPRIDHVGFVLHPETTANVNIFKAAEAAAAPLKVTLTALGVHNAAEIERGVNDFAAGPNRGLIIAPHAVTRVNSALIVDLAARHRLPAIYSSAAFAPAGGLIAYGVDLVDQFRQGADYADRLLKGAKPADLPVQLPTKLELVINLRTARALGLAVPPTLLARADGVIE